MRMRLLKNDFSFEYDLKQGDVCFREMDAPRVVNVDRKPSELTNHLNCMGGWVSRERLILKARK